MAGLLGDVLPWVYSRGDALKRQVGGLLSDPVGTAQQAMGLLADRDREQQGLMAQAFSNPQRPFQVTDRGAMTQAANNMLTGPLGFAPVGIINFPGSPPVLYHGSHKPIDRFDLSRLGSNTKASDADAGIHFSDNRADASFYADMAARARELDRGYVGRYDVDMRRPLVVAPAPDGNARKRLVEQMLDDKLFAARYAKENGFDGLVYPFGTNVDSGYTAIAFTPDQVRRIPD